MPDPRRRLSSSSVRHRLAGIRDVADREALVALCIAVLGGVTVFTIATQLFPYHSSNDDEAVYLLQAAMLLEGQLELHAGDLAGAFRPWFFVQDGGRLYPKYSPVPAAMYAVSMALFDEPRVTLALVAAGNAALTYVLASMVFDRRVGVGAAALFAASPMTLLSSSVFLPYAPTTLLNLVFAVAYLRGVRDGRLRDAGLAGVAIGLAFFARPYTAVLFAAPFICHACWSILRSVRDGEDRSLPNPVRRNALTAAIGLAFVGVTLAYNARLTGSALTFPYEAFAPRDGPGFGTRRILDHSIAYTPALALEVNGYVLWYLATRWFTAGPIGTLAALAGLGLALRRWRPPPLDRLSRGDSTDRSPNEGSAGGGRTDDRSTDGEAAAVGRTAGLLLAGLLVTVPLGNLAFWGNFNVLAGMADPTTGLVSQFGPFYHFDLLVPLSIFAAFGLVVGWRRLRNGAIRDRLAASRSPRAVRSVLLAALVTSVLVVSVANAALLSAPIERNAAHTDRFESAYEPFEERDLENAVVFQPTPYGQWQNHPFQSLRNDPGFDGELVYALDGPPERDFAVLDAYPDRDYYRYTYRGEWSPAPDAPIEAALEPLSIRDGESFAGETVVGVPQGVDRAVVRLENESGAMATLRIADPGDSIAVEWALESGSVGDGAGNESGARARLAAAGNATVPLDATDEVVLEITLVQFDGGTFTYRQEVTVRTTGDGIEVVWPSERRGCLLVTDCGTEGAYLPDRSDTHREWESFETRLTER
ncbi:ArnT family glycosyltransferase [Halosolutus amylolyticus]|uniref:ArnT family glycosyltransferase n=1 Tax=Halosolutus amylolyticus TaxID=2932267 RepID=A0ABD5PRA7_9EURY